MEVARGRKDFLRHPDSLFVSNMTLMTSSGWIVVREEIDVFIIGVVISFPMPSAL
jgi:hypothetical protein